MKFIIVLLFFFVYSSHAEPGWFSSFTSGNSGIDDDVFTKAYSSAKKNLKNMQQKIDDEEIQRDKNLPTFQAGTFGGYASQMLGSAKKASVNALTGVRNTASEWTRSLISATANSGMDFLLSEFKFLSRSTGVGSKLPLPDIQASAYRCELKASGGYFSSLSSLEKNGNIEVTILDSETVILEIPMKFSEMLVGYDNLQVKALFLGTSGSFSVNIPKNGVIIRLRLGMDSTCALNLERVLINELDGITIKFDGLGNYGSKVTETLSNLILSYLRDVIVRHIQEAIDTNLRKALEKNSMICSKFVPANN